MIRIWMVFLTLLSLAGLPGVAVSADGDEKARAEAVKFFETKIRPLFAEHCYSCHGEEKQRSDLRLDYATGFAKGGSSGDPLVVPGKPDEGLLLSSLRYEESAPAMPPKKKLSDRQIADVAKWVEMGAVYPVDEEIEAALDKTRHWSFQAMKRPQPPELADAGWVRSPIDAFILAKLADKGLAPAPPADKASLLRRVTFDLTGLPPTTEEIDAYLADESPEAYVKVVDRLLASPAYGEKWGRHWLDVARYADSNGLDENIAHGNAWRYRDYVVKSFNADKPYDQFVREQIAGDLLPAQGDAQRNEQLVATGFLSMGPKVLAEPDKRKMELDIVDEQIDTLGQAFLGLTLGCARCHDHKFDPISIDDYYGLAGILLGTTTMESFKTIARWHEHPVGESDELEAHRVIRAKIEQLKNQIKELGTPKEPEQQANKKRLEGLVKLYEEGLTELPTAMGVTDGEKPIEMTILRRGDHTNPGPVVKRRVPSVLDGETKTEMPNDGSGRLQLADWIASPANTLTARVMANRIWRWHFGQGIVASVDNFGLLGDEPSHPELLDWLAFRLIDSGWSVKALHREILLSSTYQMGNRTDPRTWDLDPEHKLLSGFPPRRLQAEEIRDSLLAVSANLDVTMGGPSLSHVKNRAFLFDHTSKDLTTYDSNRRTIYLPVIRNNLYDLFSLFDSTDAAVSSGNRPTTTVSTQALFWMNGDIVRTASENLGRQLQSKAKWDDRRRVEHLVKLAWSRPATKAELEQLLESKGEFREMFQGKGDDDKQAEEKAWAMVCQVVLAANEFVTVR